MTKLGQRGQRRPWAPVALAGAIWGVLGVSHLPASLPHAVAVAESGQWLAPGVSRQNDDTVQQVLSVIEAKRAAVRSLLESARNGEFVPIIVGFDASFVPQGLLSAERAGQQREEIADGQDSVLRMLPTGTYSGVKRFTSIPYLAMQANAEALARLEADTSVVFVGEDGIRRPFVRSSTVIVQANLVHPYVRGAGQTIAIIDNGVDKNHPAFGDRVVSEACYGTNLIGVWESMCPGGVSASVASGSGYCDPSVSGSRCSGVSDCCDHGTHVAGIAAGSNMVLESGAVADGMAPEARIIAIQAASKKAVACDGDPAPCARFWDSDVINGLERVLALSTSNAVGPIAAVNLSLGGRDRFPNRTLCTIAHPVYERAMSNLRSVGIATIAGTGNDGVPDGISAPACVSSAVPVGATWSTDGLSPGRIWDDEFLGRREGTNRDPDFPVLLAPGFPIDSAVPCPTPTTCGRGPTASKGGTSMAAPHVTGAWALLKNVGASIGRNLDVSSIANALEGTGQWVYDSRSDAFYPEIRVYYAGLALYEGQAWPPGPPSVLRSSVTGDSVRFTWIPPGRGGIVTRYRLVASDTPGGVPLAVLEFDAPANQRDVTGVSAGRYYVRLAAGNAAGWSPFSNEVTVAVSAPSAPAAPTMNPAVVSGSTVNLSWAAATTGGTPASYVVVAAESPGGPFIATLSVTSTALSVPDVPDDTYYVRVRGLNAAGAGPLSNEVVVRVGQQPATPYSLLFAEGSVIRQMSLTGQIVRNLDMGRPVGYFDITGDRSRIVYSDDQSRIWVYTVATGQSEQMLLAPWSQTLKWLPGSTSVFVHGAADGQLHSFNTASRTSVRWQANDTASAFGKNAYRGGIAFSAGPNAKVVARIGVASAGGDGVFVGDHCTTDPTHHICNLRVVSNPAGTSSGFGTIAVSPSITQDGRYAYYVERIAMNTHRVMRKDLSANTATVVYQSTTAGVDTAFGDTALFNNDQYLAFPDLYLSGDRAILVCDLGAPGGATCSATVLQTPGVFAGSTLVPVRWP